MSQVVKAVLSTPPFPVLLPLLLVARGVTDQTQRTQSFPVPRLVSLLILRHLCL